MASPVPVFAPGARAPGEQPWRSVVERILRTADELEDASRAAALSRAAVTTRAGTLTLGRRDRVLLGRSGCCDVSVGGRSVSRVHAALVRRRHAWWIEDLGSRNGTWLDGERVRERRLSHGDIVHLGSEPVRFSIR